MAKRGFGELESAILRIIKSHGRMTVSQVHKQLGEKNSYNTIMTVMLRLCNKKILAREKIDSSYAYWQVDFQEKIPTFIDQLKQKVFGMKPSELMSCLLGDTEEISDEEFAEMENWVAEAKEKRQKK